VRVDTRERKGQGPARAEGRARAVLMRGGWGAPRGADGMGGGGIVAAVGVPDRRPHRPTGWAAAT